MDDHIVAGAIVELRSGGPYMTVKWVKEGDAWCEWFDQQQKPEGRKFAVHSLKAKASR